MNPTFHLIYMKQIIYIDAIPETYISTVYVQQPNVLEQGESVLWLMMPWLQASI